MSVPPTEVLFYHLERQPLAKVLPGLVERTLERGWRAVIQAGSEKAVGELDGLLWTFRDESFLAHGTAADGHAGEQPVFLTATADNPNGAAVRFLVEGARTEPADWTGNLKSYTRVVVIFEGGNADALAAARATWQHAKAAGLAATYWQQSSEGRWEKKAQGGPRSVEPPNS